MGTPHPGTVVSRLFEPRPSLSPLGSLRTGHSFSQWAHTPPAETNFRISHPFPFPSTAVLIRTHRNLFRHLRGVFSTSIALCRAVRNENSPWAHGSARMQLS